MEYDEANNVSASYIYGVNRISESNGEVDNYYLYDGRGSVIQVVNKDEIVASYNYDPFGNITNNIDITGSFYGYNGEDTNPVTKLQYLRARYYDTENGRFMSADNYLGTIDNPLSLNRYIYVQNNPLAYMDPSGHMPVFLIPAIIGAVLGGVGGGVYAGTTSYENQKEKGDVNDWIVARDAFIGSIVGSTVGGASGLAAGGTIAVFGTTSAVTTVVGGAVSAVNAGFTYRAANEIVPGVTANLLDEADVKTFAYTETRTAEEIANDAIEAAADPRAMIIDGAVGSLAGISSYGFTQMAKYNKFSKCGNISEKAKMDVVDDVLDKTDDVVNLVDDATMAKPNSKTLRQNMINKGIEIPDYPNAAHHIVAGNSPKAAEARAILQKYGININDAANGVFLPSTKNMAQSAYHPSLHTNAYYDSVNTLLAEATSKQEVLEILEYISSSLKNGNTLP